MKFLNQKTIKKLLDIAVPIIGGVATIVGEFARQKKERQFDEMAKELAELKKQINK